MRLAAAPVHPMRIAALSLLFVGAALLATTAAHAGSVEVQFAAAEKFVDAGTSQWEEKENLRVLGSYLQVLGQKYLPADQRLKIEVTDVDLAGSVQMSRREATLIRTVKGRTDYPRITVRYTLQDARGQQLASGEEAIVDLDYAHGLPRMRDSSGLVYEKRMLDKWFRQRFVDQQAAG
ncbi:DUF3016 domain-containing protein [Caenimonas koreensis]|nr:DUF3016 domain-containing protein [Caenimonas koreensis]